MFKFIKAKGPHHSAERQRLQRELFSYSRTVQHGFPHKPTALAWDPSMRLLCIGTATGAVKVFGRPGVEFYGQHQNTVGVSRVLFLPNQGRIVTLCDDNSLHLWEVNRSSLVEVTMDSLEGKLKKISTMCCESNGKRLLLGTEGGNIYLLDVEKFTTTTDIIYQDIVMQSVPQDYKLNPGAVESIIEQPGHPDNILIGYNRGLIVLWSRARNNALKTFVSNQQLESLCWHDDGKSFTSSHNDGSYLVWDVDKDGKPTSEPVSTYGPFACRAIPKIVRKELRGKPLVVFSGGLPRATCGDKYTVSVIHDEQHVAFDFTSKVIDFVVIDTPGGDNNDKSEPDALVVLAEEELVLIDLQCKEWKMISLPYLVSVHASAVTCSQHISGVPKDLWEQIRDAGKAQTTNLYSNRPWPVDGGDLLCEKGKEPRRELLLTGHEDGTVRFWDASEVTLTPLYKFSTSQFFTGDDFEEAVPDPEDMEDDWPPFRKTGVFDPYSDDPRLALKKVVMCPLSGTLAVAGTAGHVVVCKFDTEVLDGELKVTTMNIVNDRDGFVWKGHNQLAPKQGDVHQSRGFQATAILQLHPPAAITACVVQADWGLVAAGTAHGLALFDYVKNKPVMVKCTLNPNDLTGSGDTPISRRKSFKKSLRESFRRLRKGRSTRRANSTAGAENSPPVRKQAPAVTTVTTPPGDGTAFSPLEAKPVERQIEARPVDDSMGSFVRCLYFARTFLVNVHNTNPTLWAGTNNGTVYTFTISVPSGTKRDTDDVTCHIAKEIQLKHRAPVIAIAVLDGSNKPLPEPLEVERGVAPLPDTTQPHRVIIASEEQFKIFTLPSVKAFCKYKLTAHEGARVRRMAFAQFTSFGSQPEHTEVDLLCLTNDGECLVLSIPDLKRQLTAAAIKREDINGISSLVFTKYGEALYLHSSSEFQRVSLSTTYCTRTRCYLSRPGLVDSDSDLSPEEEHKVIAEKTGEAEGDAPLVNGTNNNENAADKEALKENGDDSSHNVTVTSSVGDITIDSVKDYLGSGEDLAGRGGVTTVTKTVTLISSSNQVVDGVVVTSSSSAATTTANNTSHQVVIESVTDGAAATLETRPIQVSEILLRAPLASTEELDSDSQVNGGGESELI